MAAPPGNQFWKARASHGRKRIFQSRDALWQACCEYFQWVEDNPLWETKAFHYQGVVVQEQVPKMRPMTIGGLCIFLDINQDTWKAWRKVDDFSAICEAVDDIIREQKFAGAAADLLNPSIIARDLGLSEKSQHDHTSSDKSMTPKPALDASKLSSETMEEILRAADEQKASGDDENDS